MTPRLAGTLGRLRWPIVGQWLFLLALAGLVAAPLSGLLSSGGWHVSGSDSEAVDLALRHGFVGRDASSITVVVHDEWYTSSQPGFVKRAARVLDDVAATPPLAVSSRLGYASTSGDVRQEFVGRDGSTSVEVLGLRLEDGPAIRLLPAVQRDLSARYAPDGLEVSLVGPTSARGEIAALGQSGLARAAALTLPLVLILLVVLCGGLVAAVVSLTVGVTSALGGVAVVSLVARVTELSLLAEYAAVLLGLAVGVGGSFAVISAFREELTGGATVDEALVVTLRTSGRAVVASGAALVAAMSALFLVPLGAMTSIALGAVAGVGCAVLTSLLALPALLRILGPRINAGRIRLWGGRSQALRSALLGVALVVMVGVALPAKDLLAVVPDASMIPAGSPVRQGFDRMQAAFGPGSTSPIDVVVTSTAPMDTPPVSAAVVALEQRLSELPSVDRVESALPALKGVSPVAPLTALQPSVRAQLPADVAALVGHDVSTDGRRLVLEVVPKGGAAHQSTRDLLVATQEAAASAGIPGATVQVGGETAEGVAVHALIADRVPWVVGVVLAATCLLLLVRFRSVRVPLRALLLGLLSVVATVGILVGAFQAGFGSGLLGYGMVAAIAITLSLLTLVMPGGGIAGRGVVASAPMPLTEADLSAEWVLEDVELQPAESRG